MDWNQPPIFYIYFDYDYDYDANYDIDNDICRKCVVLWRSCS
jgi:hypothetical protein